LNEEDVIIKTKNKQEITVERETWNDYEYKYDSEQKTFEAKIIGSYKNIALRIAEAMTVHKAQGQTLDAGFIDFGGWTPPAITYVALSRMTSLQGIGLKNRVQHYHIKPSKEALEFLSHI
jgi:ATP-dependent DNA helicase PIF1